MEPSTSYTPEAATSRSLSVECIMEREDDIIDLGAASVETLGAGGIPVDENLGQFQAGLSDD